MSAPSPAYPTDDPETALKYAVQRIRGFDRVQVIEGFIEPLSPDWDHESTIAKVREHIAPVVNALGCLAGSGDLDLLYLLVDRQQRTCTLYSAPGNLGYTKVDGPHPFGTPLPLPEPFDLELDTSAF
ncbi:hypothetical protein [Streptomyces malaysiensis]|uniref:hypothetical protein n=1 Tax=Streptomyces malaysiensis TaxID=92644 RepID=UPI00368004F9